MKLVMAALAVTLSACAPAASGTLEAALAASAELETDPPVLVPVTGGPRIEAFAAAGDVTLAAYQSAPDVRLTRLDAAGAPLDRAGVPVPAGGTVRLAWTGSDYLLAYDGAGTRSELAVVARRVSADLGRISEPFAIAPGAWLQDLTCGPDLCAVVWTVGSELRAARIGAAGVLDPGGLVVAGDVNAWPVPSTAAGWSGDRFLIAWTAASGTSRAVRARHLGTGGQLLEATPIAVSPVTAEVVGAPAVAAGDRSAVVAWTATEDGVAHARAVRIGDGVVRDAVPLDLGAVAVAWATRHGARVAIATTDLVTEVTEPHHALALHWVEDTGAAVVAGPVLSTLPTPERTLGVATGDVLLVANGGDASTEVPPGGVRRFDREGEPLDATWQTVTYRGNQQSSVALVAGSRPLLLWRDDRAGQLAASGTPVDVGGDQLGAPTFTFPIAQWTRPDAAQGSDGWLVTWQPKSIDDSPPYRALVQRLDRDGAADGAVIEVATGISSEVAPQIASDGDRYLVAWIEERHVGGPVREVTVAGRFVGLDGAPIGPAMRWNTAITGGRELDIAWLGDRYVVTWVTGLGSVAFMTVGRDGRAGAASMLTDGVSRDSQAAIASAGDGHAVVVWDVHNSLLAGAWIGPDGVPGAHFELPVPDSSHPRRFALAVRGDEVAAVIDGDGAIGLTGFRVTRRGQVFGRYALATVPWANGAAVASTADGYLVTYTRRSEAWAEPARVRGQVHVLADDGEVCETGFACASGGCTDGVCGPPPAPDAGMPDPGTAPDAGVPDPGSAPDAGVPGDGGDGGSGCSASRGGAGILFGLLALALTPGRMRRRRRS